MQDHLNAFEALLVIYSLHVFVARNVFAETHSKLIV